MPKRKTTTKTRTNPEKSFEGRWRITWMDQWDLDYIDEETEGYFEFQPRGSGSFQFAYVEGIIDYRMSTRDGKPCAEFTWDGNDESEAAMGRGWAVVEDGELSGMIFFHEGDESAFRATKRQESKRRKTSNRSAK